MNRVRLLANVLQEFSLPLVIGVIAGLAVANVDDPSYQKLVDFHLFGEGVQIFGHEVTVKFLINQVFMIFFFGIATKEITDSALPGGALNPVPKAINPLLATLGGIVAPAGLYFLLTFVFYGGTDNFSAISKGWAIPTATDIALAWLVARLVFGNGHPAVNFLLLLAVADDAIGLGIIAVFYPDPELPVRPEWLLLTAGGMVLAFAMRRMQVKYWILYVAIAGAMSWFGLLKASIEPALALVVIVPFLPGPKSDSGMSMEPVEQLETDAQHGASAARVQVQGHSPLERFEHQLKPFVDLGLFFFAFANAGVPFSKINMVTWIVLLSLIVGKTIGITLFSAVATMVGFPLPTGMRLKHLAVAGLIAGLGLTVALFVAGKAFSDPGLAVFEQPAKMGAVFSGGVALLALIAGAVLRVKDGGGAGTDKS